MAQQDLIQTFTEQQIEDAEQQILEKQKISDYDIREYSVEMIIEKFTRNISTDEAEIFIPDYQREMIWKDKQQSRFIESILINLPVPYLYVADSDENEGRLEIVDGSQRIRTLTRFLQNQLELNDLTFLTKLNGIKFEDLPKSRQRRFKRKTIRLIELTSNVDEEARRQMFDRLNSGGTQLTSMEKRRGSKDGKFLVLVKELSINEKFQRLCPLSEVRIRHREYEELVLRFFAYIDRYKDFGNKIYASRVEIFLDSYLEDMNDSDFDSRKMKGEFEGMLDFVDKTFQYGFKKNANNNSVPRIRFEAMAIGAALALREDSDLMVDDVNWLFGHEFGSLTRSDASNSLPKIINRIHFVRDNLLGRTPELRGDPEKIFEDPRRSNDHNQKDLF